MFLLVGAMVDRERERVRNWAKVHHVCWRVDRKDGEVMNGVRGPGHR